MEISCKCGEVVLDVDTSKGANRLRCCCNSCRGYSKFQGEEGRLDEFGAVELYQTVPNAVKIKAGREQLGTHLISEKGILRWHCKNCGTHLANTMQTPKIQFIGLPIDQDHASPNAPELGEFLGYVQTKHAPMEQPKKKASFFSAGFKIMWRAFRAEKNSDWQADDEWIVQPQLMSAEERQRLFELATSC